MSRSAIQTYINSISFNLKENQLSRAEACDLNHEGMYNQLLLIGMHSQIFIHNINRRCLQQIAEQFSQIGNCVASGAVS